MGRCSCPQAAEAGAKAPIGRKCGGCVRRRCWPSRSSSPGIGLGGGLTVTWDRKGVRTLDFGKNPEAATRDMYLVDGKADTNLAKPEVLLWVSREWFGDSGTSTRNKAPAVGAARPRSKRRKTESS